MPPHRAMRRARATFSSTIANLKKEWLEFLSVEAVSTWQPREPQLATAPFLQGTMNNDKLQWILRSLLVFVLSSLAVQGAGACPRVADKFVAAALDTNGDGTLDVFVKGRVIPLIIDIDELSLIVIQPSTAAFVVESSGGGYASRTLSAATAAGYAVPEGQYNVTPMNVRGSSCMSLLLHGLSNSLPSFLVNFADDGQPLTVQALSATTIGYPISGYTLSRRDLSGDGRDDVEVVEGQIVRAVLSSRADGTLRDDASASALAVWRSFLAAAARSDATVAAQHLSDGARAAYGPALSSSASQLPALSSTVVDYEAKVVTDGFVSVTTVVRNGASYQFFEAHIVRSKTGWRIDSF